MLARLRKVCGCQAGPHGDRKLCHECEIERITSGCSIQSFASRAISIVAIAAALIVIAFEFADMACAQSSTSQPVASSPSAPPDMAAEFQAAADSGYLKIPIGNNRLSRPIEVHHSTKIEGLGHKSRLVCDSGVTRAITVSGKSGGSVYATYLSDFSANATIAWVEYGQHCSMERVWVSEAAGNGIELRNGEGLALRDVVVYGNSGLGLLVGPSASSNAITVENLNAQANKGNGVVLTSQYGGTVQSAVFRDCKIQGNGLGNGDCELLLEGDVKQTLLSSCWFEKSPAVRSETGIRMRQLNGRYVGGTRFEGNCVISCCDSYAIVAVCYQPVIEQLWLTAGSGKSRFGGFNLEYVPTGQMRYFDKLKCEFVP